MNLKTLLLLSVAGGAGASAAQKSDACLECSDTCALVPPADKSGFPCYQGSIKDANFCYDTDPLLATGTTWQCGTCAAAGFDSYLQNDPIYKNMELWQDTVKKTVSVSNACLECSDSCALVPPADKKGFPCYQGTVKDAHICFDTDPLLAEGTTWQCGTCEAAGYDTYLMNDPIYKNMELWKNGAAKTQKNTTV